MLEAAPWVVKTWWLIYTDFLSHSLIPKPFASTHRGGVDVR